MPAPSHFYSCSPLLPFFLAVLLLLPAPAPAQRYNFINLNVENGLAQSQATVFAQDVNNRLLVGTYGGLSIFDGSNFINYSKSNGLSQNIVNTLSCDRRHNIWIGTNNGISRFDGRGFSNFTFSSVAEENGTAQIETDLYGNVWARADNDTLYRFDGKKFVREPDADSVTAITLDRSGKLWAAFPDGIYVFNGKSWHKEIPRKQVQHPVLITRMLFGHYSGTLYCFSFSSFGFNLLASENGTMKIPGWINSLPRRGIINDMLEDSKGNIWLSMDDGGAWVYSQQSWNHYTYQNGLTDDIVRSFYEDREGNIWLGTNGSGIFRYTGSIFTYYDRTSGLANPSIMSIAQDASGALYFASNSSGLYKLVKGTPRKVALPEYLTRTYALLTDTLNRLWIGTEGIGLWYYDGKEASLFRPCIEQNLVNITHLYRYGSTIWISSRLGLFRLDGHKLSREHTAAANGVYASCMIGQDSLLLGTLKGAYIYRTDRRELLRAPLLGGSATLCLEADARRVYIGTDDKGLMVWDKAQRTFTRVDHQSGLSCDYIYSILRDSKGNIWVGTGCGIDKLSFTDNGRFRLRSFGRSDGLLGVENNANASFEDREGYLWFGTTKGVFRYNPYVSYETPQAPKVILQSVKLFSKELAPGQYADSLMPFSTLPWRPVLPTGQNHLTFSFKGIYLTNPEKIRYRYQLVGIDKTFTETDQTTVIYPNLPPGSYLFKVWASDAEGNWYSNAATYPFVINTPYYTTWPFRIGMGLLLIGLFLGGVYYRNRQKELRRRWEEKLREEEQAVVRQKTAEDFHDEIGNKLTRINLLATIAESKLQQPAGEVRKILQQIQQHVASLYNGSKDIIWSLQPDSDYLDEIVYRIRENATQLLEDTPIRFVYQQLPAGDLHIKLPPDHSRNLILIFKEAVNNAVKHAEAASILFQVRQEESRVLLELQDDGKGFDPALSGKGNGLGNISNRARRIGAVLTLDSRPGAGTMLRVAIMI